jgi:hypothetical protein
MMKRPPGLAGALLAAITLGLLALLAIHTSPAYQAAAVDRLPTPDAAHGQDAPTMGTAGTAFFVVGFPPEDWTFTIMLTDTATIQEATDIISGVQTEKVRVMGTIVKAPAFYNPPWSYHLDPASIQFFEVAVEVCDAHPLYVEQHLDEVCGAFLPGCVWCPCASRVVAEMHLFEQLLPVIVK